jgi:hypothetical protein
MVYDKRPRGVLFFYPTIMSPTRRSAWKGACMPIRLLIDNSENGYLATDTAVLAEAFEGALKELGLEDRNDPATLVVANHVISFAKAGVLDPVRLRDLTLKAIRREQRQPPTTRLLAIQGGR